MIKTATEQFKTEPDVDAERITVVAEITLDNLALDGNIDEQDFLDRTELLCAQGLTVLVTDCEKHQKLINYFSEYRITKLGMVIGVRILLDLINETYYQNVDGSLLLAFGALFNRHVKMYVYPVHQEGSSELMNCHNLPIPEGIKFLYQHLQNAKHIEDIRSFNSDLLHIYSKEVLKLLRSDDHGWEDMVPRTVVSLVREKCLFNFPCQRLEFEY